jgi:hypothetical protein
MGENRRLKEELRVREEEVEGLRKKVEDMGFMAKK